MEYLPAIFTVFGFSYCESLKRTNDITIMTNCITWWQVRSRRRGVSRGSNKPLLEVNGGMTTQTVDFQL